MQKCNRCDKEDRIPTHQGIKFDLKNFYFCSECWGKLGKWRYDTPKSECVRCKKRISKGKLVTWLNTLDDALLCEDCFSWLKKWIEKS